MKFLAFKFKAKHSIEIISLLYVVLFTYAAVSKFLDFNQFKIQLGQSPLLTAFADWVVWLVPITELLITILLVYPKYRLLGLYASFSLMLMFTTYIFLILTFSDFIPCSCGGILEKLGWTEHLIFNMFFIAMAVLAIALWKQNSNT